MRTIWTLASKDLRLLVRDRLALFFVMGVPILYGVFFGLITGAFQSGGQANFEVAIVDEDDSKWSQEFIKILRQENEETSWHTDFSRSAALDRCRRGKLVAVIVLPAGFGERAGIFFQQAPELQIAVDPSRSAESGLLTGLLMQGMGKLAAARMQDQQSMHEALDESIGQLQSDKEMPLATKLALVAALKSFQNFFDQLSDAPSDAKAEGTPEFEFVKIEKLSISKPKKSKSGAPLENVRTAWDISFPQATIWGILGCATTFAASLVKERRQGSLIRLQVAPLSPSTIVAGKAAACFISVVLVIGMMLLLGIALGMRPRQPWVLIPAMLATAFCFTGIMTCIATMGKSEEAVSGASWGANIVMAMFGGGMIPLAFMPSWMKTVSRFDPVSWSILVLEGGIWRDFSWAEAALPLGVLVAIGALALLIGMQTLGRRL